MHTYTFTTHPTTADAPTGRTPLEAITNTINQHPAENYDTHYVFLRTQTRDPWEIQTARNLGPSTRNIREAARIATAIREANARYSTTPPDNHTIAQIFTVELSGLMAPNIKYPRIPVSSVSPTYIAFTLATIAHLNPGRLYASRKTLPQLHDITEQRTRWYDIEEHIRRAHARPGAVDWPLLADAYRYADLWTRLPEAE